MYRSELSSGLGENMGLDGGAYLSTFGVNNNHIVELNEF